MIKIIRIQALDDFQLQLEFSDGSGGLFNGHPLLQRTGPLLDALRDPTYFARAFIDAGALCWPNGLELSPARIYEQCHVESQSTL